MTRVLEGTTVAKSVEEVLKVDIAKLETMHRRIPQLVVIMVGDNPASLSYVGGKEKACARVGIKSQVLHFERTIPQNDLIKIIEKLNADPKVDGILIQLPLPTPLESQAVVNAVSPEKDVDGLTPSNVGKLHMNIRGFVPCTPKGIIYLLDYYGIEIAGKNIAVIGRSNLVGRPVAQLLVNRNATVTICHSKTKNLPHVTRNADIIVVAIGKAKFLNKAFVNTNSVVIDVGINRTDDGRLVGDADFEELNGIVESITPVPKGVGPLTIAMLLQNTVEAYRAHEMKEE